MGQNGGDNGDNNAGHDNDCPQAKDLGFLKTRALDQLPEPEQIENQNQAEVH
jgi:hypothetical protein